MFLVGPESGQVGFEIRSLQEFMAAEALMDGSDDRVAKRLREVASSENWRNVFLFAAGKCFADRQHLRDTVEAVCHQLNEEVDGPLRLTLAGSRLALDLLEDGPALHQPKYARALTRAALRLLDLPPEAAHRRLAELSDEGTADIYIEEVSRRLTEQDAYHKLGAWACLASLYDSGIAWARMLASNAMPKSADECADICKAAAYVGASRALTRWLTELTPHIGPVRVRGIAGATRWNRQAVVAPDVAPQWLLEVLEALEYSPDRYALNVNLMLGNPRVHVGRLSLIPLDRSSVPSALREQGPVVSGLVGMSDPTGLWSSWIAAARFIEHPSASALANFLRQVAAGPDDRDWPYPAWMPWVLEAPLMEGESSSELLAMAARAETGELGGREAWVAAEYRWMHEGISDGDLVPASHNGDLADITMPVVRFPTSIRFGWSYNDSEAARGATALLHLHSALPPGAMKATIANLTADELTVLSENAVAPAPPAESLSELVDTLSLGSSWVSRDLLSLLIRRYPTEWAFVQIEKLASCANFYEEALGRRVAGTLAEKYAENPSMGWLLRILSKIATDLDPEDLPASLVSPARFEDPELKRSAVIVNLVLTGLNLQERAALAGSAADLVRERPEFCLQILSVLEGERNEGWLESPMIENLWSALPREHWDTACRLMALARRALRLRRSRLANPEVWSELKLPPGLLGLLPN